MVREFSHVQGSWTMLSVAEGEKVRAKEKGDVKGRGERPGD